MVEAARRRRERAGETAGVACELMGVPVVWVAASLTNSLLDSLILMQL